MARESHDVQIVVDPACGRPGANGADLVADGRRLAEDRHGELGQRVPGKRLLLRLAVVCALGVSELSLGSPSAEAQTGKIYRIGALVPFSASDGAAYLDTFRERLRELGDVEGQNVAIEWRGANGMAERFPDLAAQLVRLKVDVILAVNNPAIAAAQRASRTIPVVMVMATDPVGAGFVASLARPGGNITGLSFQFTELGTKRVQLLREIVPNISRTA